MDILHYFYLMGRPETVIPHLTNMKDLVINADTGWNWTISHPSFYHWNRVLSALLGTGAVWVTYLIGKHVFNKWIGLIAAFFLAILPYHINMSSLASVDAPVSFFVLMVVFFSVLFIKYKNQSHLILSLIFVGVSVATKYNAALCVSIPFLAFIVVYSQSKEAVRPYMWFLIPAIPIMVFFLIMPYAFMDLKGFLKGVGFEIRHYKILGHYTYTSIPGWEHFNFQMDQFYKNLGLVNIILIGVYAPYYVPKSIVKSASDFFILTLYDKNSMFCHIWKHEASHPQ
ncbi:MAG: glycosyltransferase family 39 protein [Deltaproteobacteria bacterium]|nr:glycosyltransferase family 39 protein [Deltaproteobacteria bacterium]